MLSIALVHDGATPLCLIQILVFIFSVQLLMSILLAFSVSILRTLLLILDPLPVARRVHPPIPLHLLQRGANSMRLQPIFHGPSFFFVFFSIYSFVCFGSSSSTHHNVPSSSTTSFTESSTSVPIQATPSSSQLIPMEPVPMASSASSETITTVPSSASNPPLLAVHDTLTRFVHLLFHCLN